MPNPTFKPFLLYQLIFLAALMVVLRLVYFSSDMASGDKFWQLAIDMSFDARLNETVASISTPFSTAHNRLVHQAITHPGLKIRLSKTADDSNREISAVATQNGPLVFSVEFYIHQSSTPSIQINKTLLPTSLVELYLINEAELNPDHPQVKALLNRLTEGAEDRQSQILQIQEYCRSLIFSNKKLQRSVNDIIKDHKASIEERALVFVALARAMQFPARMVTGFILEESLEVKPHYWVQVYDNSSWQSFDPYYGYRYELPVSFMPFSYNNSIVSLEKGENLKVDYFLEEDLNTGLKIKQGQPHWISIFDLNRLKLETRSTLAILMLLPFGVLITAIFRHFIGIHSYGVFTPTLLALAINFNQWQTTMVILIIIIFFSILGRRIFPEKMLRTPRLAIIFTFVAFSMALGVSFVDYYMPNPEGYAVLLPIVILTTLIDRFYQTLAQKGLKIAYIRLFWTFIITFVCFPVVQYEPLGYLLVEFPELHLLTIASILFITHYQGKTLSHFIPSILKEPVEAEVVKVNVKSEN